MFFLDKEDVKVENILQILFIIKYSYSLVRMRILEKSRQIEHVSTSNTYVCL